MKRLPIAFAVLAIAGCSTLSESKVNPLNWFGSSTPAQKIAALPELKNSVAINTLWQASVGNSGASIFSPTVVGGSVYAAAADGDVARFDAATGRQLWHVNAGDKLTGGVGADGSLAVVGTGKGEVIALDGAGSLLWKARVSSEVLAAPVVVGDVVIVRSADSRIFALSAQDGKRRWLYQRASTALSVRSPAGMVVMRGNVYAGFSGGKLVAIALNNGALRWEGTVSQPRGATELERMTDVVGLPYVSSREVCAVAYQGRVTCFDSGNGSVLWSREISSTSGLDADARTVYVSDDKGAVHALDRATGNSLWKQDQLTQRNLSAPLPVGGQVAVADFQGFVHLLAGDNGSIVGRAATDGSPISTSPIALDNGFLVQTRNGKLYAFSVK